MKIALGPIVQKAWGKLGNQVFSTWKNQPYVKQMTNGVSNPHSAKQEAIRSMVALLSPAYEALSSSQKSGWETLGANYAYRVQAETGVRAIIRIPKNKCSGINAFIGYNILAYSAGAITIISNPPVGIPQPLIFASITASVATGTLTVNWSFPGSTPGTKYIRVWTHAVTKGVYSNQLLASTEGSLETVDITNYQGKLGISRPFSSIVGTRILLQCDVVDNATGLASNPGVTLDLTVA